MKTEDKPKNTEEYRRWLSENQKINIDHKQQTYFETVTARVLELFQKSPLWQELSQNFSNYNDEFLKNTGYELFIGPTVPVLHKKSFDSAFLKAFRKNVLLNKSWPTLPTKGAVDPVNLHKTINDVVRTCFVVKYLDGVQFLVDKFAEACKTNKLEHRVFFEARDEGYYAAHFYVKVDMELTKQAWDTEIVPIEIELQVTTQLQEVIRKMLHHYYEKRRVSVASPKEKWQWEYKSDEFSVNYLGHILHYLAGS